MVEPLVFHSGPKHDSYLNVFQENDAIHWNYDTTGMSGSVPANIWRKN